MARDWPQLRCHHIAPLWCQEHNSRLIALIWCKKSAGQLSPASTQHCKTSPLYWNKNDVCFFPFTQKPAPFNYKHHPNVPQLQSTWAGFKGLPCWNDLEVRGGTEPCPATTLGSQLRTHLQRAPRTHRNKHCLEQNSAQGNTCPYSSDSAKTGRHLDNHIAERAMSDTRNKTWHLLPYERRKKFPWDFRFSEC